jgi:hypothetical protein
MGGWSMRQSMRTTVILGLGLFGFFIGVVTSMMLTPILWKLETLTNLELAGHSGPAEWLLLMAGVFGSLSLIGTYVLVRRRTKA